MAATFIDPTKKQGSRVTLEDEERLTNLYGSKPPPAAPPPTSFQQTPPPASPRTPDRPITAPPGVNTGAVVAAAPPPSAFDGSVPLPSGAPPHPDLSRATQGPQPGVIATGTGAPPPASGAPAGVADISAPGARVGPDGQAKDYFTGDRWNDVTLDANGNVIDDKDNTWRRAEAATQYGLHESLNPTLAQQEQNLGAIATAAGDYARAQGDQTQAQGAAVASTTDAIAGELINNQAGRELSPIDVIAGDPAQQQAGTLSRLRAYDADPGTSAAERSIAQQSNRDFANSLALARSGGTAAQRAWGERAAVAQNFERQAERGRNLATLRAEEQERAKARELSALSAEAGVAAGADTTRLNAGTAQAETDLALQELQDRYTLDSQRLGVDTLLQGQTLGLQADQQGFNQSMMGYQLPYQAQQDIISQGNFQQQLGAQNFGVSQGLAVQAQQREDAANALPWQIGAGVVGSLAGAGAMALTKSDRRAKTAIQRLREEAAEAVEQSPGYSYKYKRDVGEDADTLFAGPLAQDLEKTRFGKGLVFNGSDGLKRVRTDRLALLDHAALGSVIERLRRLEEVA